MPDAGFDHLIFPLPPLPTTGNGTSAPSSGNNRDFDDALDRAAQPSQPSDDDISRSGYNSIDSSNDLRDSRELESRLPASLSEQYRPIARHDENSRRTDRPDTTAKPTRRSSAGQRRSSSTDSNRVEYSRSDENRRNDDKSTQSANNSDDSNGAAPVADGTDEIASSGTAQPVTQNSPSKLPAETNGGAATDQAKHAAGQAQLAANELTNAAQNQAATSDQSQSKTDEGSAPDGDVTRADVIQESGNASEAAVGVSHSTGKDKSTAAISELQTEATAASNQPKVIAESQQTNAVSDGPAVASHQSASNASAKLELTLNGGPSAT
jgi:hypothetical protein